MKSGFHAALFFTSVPPESSEDFVSALYELDNNAGKLAGILEVDVSWLFRWDSLSFGERKRFQLACALWLEPEILAVNEPANHLDLPSITALEETLEGLDCAMLVVSHDRKLRENLCRNEWEIVIEDKNNRRLVIK